MLGAESDADGTSVIVVPSPQPIGGEEDDGAAQRNKQPGRAEQPDDSLRAETDLPSARNWWKHTQAMLQARCMAFGHHPSAI